MSRRSGRGLFTWELSGGGGHEFVWRQGYLARRFADIHLNVSTSNPVHEESNTPEAAGAM